MLPRRLLSLRPASFLLGAGLLAYAGCSSSGTSAPPVTHPTMIEVAPESFLGSVPCSAHSGGLKRYVATLFDLDYSAGGAPSDVMNDEGNAGDTATEDEVQLPSSLPTPCTASVGFGYVAVGRHYQVRIDGYDTPNLAPRAAGSREMVLTDEDDQPLAVPRWRAACYRAIAVGSTVVRADHCDETFHAPSGAPTTGSVRIALASLLGDLSCGGGGGGEGGAGGAPQVDHFDVTVGSETKTVACSRSAQAIFDDRDPAQPVSVLVTAFSAGNSSAFAATSCRAQVVADARVDAACGTLTQQGTLRVDLPAALGLLGLSCDPSKVGAVKVTVPDSANLLGSTQTLLPPECLRAFEHSFAADDATIVVTAFEAEHPTVEAGTVTCHGQVTPGALTLAVCEKKDAG